MSTLASRQVRSARNAMVEALGLGETYPLRDLPVTCDPPVVPFGGKAVVAVADSERGVRYRLLDQAGEPLPNGAAPEGVGNGAPLAIESPAITDDVTFTLRASRANGRAALLAASAPVKVGLDATLPVAAVSASGLPVVIDHRAIVEIDVEASQEGVTYRLVGRPSPDPAAPDDFAAVAADIALSAAEGVDGTGGAIRLPSVPLVEDTRVHVRAIKVFGGRDPRPPQATLLKATVPVFVRANAGLAVRADPAVVEHAASTTIRIETSQPGVAYRLHTRAVADAEFSRVDPPDAATLVIPTDDGEVRVVAPPPTPVWEAPAGFEPVGAAVAGTGAVLGLPLTGLTADTLVLIEADTTHADGSFATAERLDQALAVLVRPDPQPGLRLEAGVASEGLVRLSVLAGQPGVFYGLSAAARLGALYRHQRDPADAALNKGIGAFAVAIDLVVASGDPDQPTSAAPPPIPFLDLSPLPLPCTITIDARRAMTGLTADLGSVTIAPLPALELRPPAVAPGESAKVDITAPASGERYALLVNGRQVADPVRAGNQALTLDTGALAADDRVELWASAGAADAAVVVERRLPLGITVG